MIEADVQQETPLSHTEAPPPLSVGREVLVGLAVFALYSAVDALPIPHRQARARVHGLDILRFETHLHIDVERGLNLWLAARPVLRVLANYEYAITYIASALLMLAWLFVRRPARYRVARNSFALINLVGACVFALYPVMPPRMLPQFVDTVSTGHTVGSWGSPLVSHANQLAAMPSLHVAWALWVSVELARLSARRSVQVISALHIVVTAFVIVATANHYLLDALGGVLLVWLCVTAADRITPVRRGPRVGPGDAFFLAVESATSPQHVGGLILLDTTESMVTRAALIEAVTGRLAELPRFRQRLAGGDWFWRPYWVPHPEIDWDWHVAEHEPCAPDALVAELQATPLPRDRPLWRLVLAPDVVPGRTAVIFLMHHVVADGIGVIAHALALMEPPRPATQDGGHGRVGPVRQVAGTVAGIAQLAVERPQRLRLPTAPSHQRVFGTFRVPLRAVREAGRRHGARVSDMMLCSVAGGLSRIGAVPTADRGRFRVTVPLMMRTPATAPEGNYTAAVMIDLPYGPMPEAERLAVITRQSRRLYTGTRALGSRFVMAQVGGLLPAGVHRSFARAVYGRRFFQAVVSNLPGLDEQVRLGGAPLRYVHPLLPAAPGAPLSVGAIGWYGQLNYGVSAEPALTHDAERLCTAMREVLAELGVEDLPVTPTAGPAVTP